ncbi:MAG: hypothetical protein HND44_01680 [Chloroflexi bacterium]|nr:hypothetical protein [Ardenticatenaceae bacterium]MBL1127209.1 hypothetical protein [Chloroflexota bacterium]NOG33271.1 hypothetical protein [Chloroflexota bacterium]GIK56091.1 MAG: hypothetical protein BroJett015_17540 [Chloroflexota bacterium]
MKRWPRRFSYVLIVISWLMVMCFPTFAFTLARNGQIEVGSNPRNHLRFFMVQEKNADGIGVEWTRPLSGQSTCAKTSVTYLLWESDGQNQNVTYCQCSDPVTGAALGTCEQ